MEAISSFRELTGPDSRIVLRPWVEPDLEVGMMAFAEREIDRFSWPEPRPYELSDAIAYLEQAERDRRDGSALELAITDARDTAATLGGISLYDIDAAAATASTGYWLGRLSRGRGFASEALGLLSRWAFEVLGLERLELTADPGNLASHAVAERCGFRREGVRRAHLRFKDGRRDSLVFSLLPTDPR